VVKVKSIFRKMSTNTFTEVKVGAEGRCKSFERMLHGYYVATALWVRAGSNLFKRPLQPSSCFAMKVFLLHFLHHEMAGFNAVSACKH
jgi:hypothetical protein